MEGRGRRRFLSREELELWAKVTRHDEPLARVRAVGAPGIPASPVAMPAAAAVAGQQGGVGPRETTVAQSPAKPAIPKTKPVTGPPPAAPFDPRESKRIARGRREIDARLDLHGLRQQDAYVALRRFLAHAQAQGHRHVLIITGKGGTEPDVKREFWTSEERGILRRLVPHWLCEPSFRLHVVSFTESALRHGGSGALYVTIRKGARARV